MCASLTEEAEAIGWYEQRLAVEGDAEALAGALLELRDAPAKRESAACSFAG